MDGDDDFPLDPTASADFDGDGMPDNITGTSPTGLIEDDDDDNDGYSDGEDAFPLDPDRYKLEDGGSDEELPWALIIVGIIIVAIIAFAIFSMSRKKDEAFEE